MLRVKATIIVKMTMESWYSMTIATEVNWCGMPALISQPNPPNLAATPAHLEPMECSTH